MFIQDLNELIAWYKVNNIPFNMPIDCEVKCIINSQNGAVSIQISGNTERYGINLQHLDTPEKRQNRIDETRRTWFSHV